MKITRAAATIGIILLSMAGLSGCGRARELVEMNEMGQSGSEQELIAIPLPGYEAVNADENSEDNESDGKKKLTAMVEDLEEAEKIADLYDIELDSYSYGVAVYVTDKDVQELINMGEENDYPTLTPNHKDKLYTVE